MSELPPILQKGSPLPTSMGRCADLLHDVQQLRLAMEKEAAVIAERESEIKEYIIANLTKGEDTGASGLRYRVQVLTSRKPIIQPDGWGGFTSWMNKHGRFDLIQKRLSDKAVMEVMDAEKRLLPGLEIMNVPKISLTKV